MHEEACTGTDASSNQPITARDLKAKDNEKAVLFGNALLQLTFLGN